MRSSQSLRFDDDDFLDISRAYPSSYVAATHPSFVRVFAKSLHLLALGWVFCVACLWITLKENVGWNAIDARTVVFALAPLLFVEALAWWTNAWPARRVRREGEWTHAFLWSVVPFALLFGSFFLILNS